MVTRISFLFTFIFIVSCSKQLDDLILQRTIYDGKELKTNGYYSSNPSIHSGNTRFVILYKNGVCFDIGYDPLIPRTQSEMRILKNKIFIDSIKAIPNNIGVFQINSMPLSLKRGHMVERELLLLRRKERS